MHPNLPIGSLFPHTRLRDIKAEAYETTHYQLSVEDDNVFLRFKQAPSKEFATMTWAPIQYENLMRRFVWRHEVVLLILQMIGSDGYTGPTFNRDMEHSMVRNFIYANEVIGHVRTALRGDAETGIQCGGVRLFDIYMLEECYVGRHEPAAIIRWQIEHPELNLRCTDVHEADWAHSQRVIGPDWEGQVHRWRLNALDNAILKQLLIQAHRLYRDWFDHPYPQFVNSKRFYSGDVVIDLEDNDDDDSGSAEDNSDSDKLEGVMQEKGRGSQRTTQMVTQKGQEGGASQSKSRGRGKPKAKPKPKPTLKGAKKTVKVRADDDGDGEEEVEVDQEV